MTLKSERLVILLSKREKARLAKLAEREQVSMGELARAALIQLDDVRPETGGPRQGRESRNGTRAGDTADPAISDIRISPEQAATLDRFAEVTLRTMARANQALDKAFEEVEATKAYFAQSRAGAGATAKSGSDA